MFRWISASYKGFSPINTGLCFYFVCLLFWKEILGTKKSHEENHPAVFEIIGRIVETLVNMFTHDVAFRKADVLLTKIYE